jgi:hypothetical protein
MRLLRENPRAEKKKNRKQKSKEFEHQLSLTLSSLPPAPWRYERRNDENSNGNTRRLLKLLRWSDHYRFGIRRGEVE